MYVRSGKESIRKGYFGVKKKKINTEVVTLFLKASFLQGDETCVMRQTIKMRAIQIS
jgi:hypothetical protein